MKIRPILEWGEAKELSNKSLTQKIRPLIIASSIVAIIILSIIFINKYYG